MTEFKTLAAPTLAWLKAGAPHVNIGQYTDIGFNMVWILNQDKNDYADNHCNTVCCMVGHMQLVHNIKDSINDVTNFLGLTDEEYWALFYPERMLDRTPIEAAEVLERFIETGEIRWD